MQLRLAFGTYKDAPGDAAVLVAATDEYVIDTWGGLPDFYIEEVEKHRAAGNELREVSIEVDSAAIDALFAVPHLGRSEVGEVEGSDGA